MDRGHMTGKILNLTLKIIYLLTGEDYVPIKRSDDDTAPSPPSYERENDEKILELTNRIIELLTGEGEHLNDESKTSIKEDHKMHVLATLTCKEEEAPMIISADQSSQTNSQDNDQNIPQVDGIECKEEEIATDITSGELKLTHRHHSNQSPVDASLNIASFPVGRGVDPLETMDAHLNIVVIDAGEGDVRFKEEEEEVPIGPRSDAAKAELQKHPRPTYSEECLQKEDEESEDTETEDEDNSSSSLMKSEELKTCVKIKKEEFAKDTGPGGKKTYLECGTTKQDTATSVAHQKIFPIDRRLVTAEKPFFCADCGGFFKHKSSLVLHRRIHSGEKPFSCTQCGKEFIQKANYIRHQRLHTGEKPYKCTECGKLYAQKQSLIMHQKFHAENEPFSCPECGENFIRQSHLVNHRKTHKGLRRYSCPDCGDFFMLRSSLVIHQRVHSAEKPLSTSND
ncbi:oocyte zinc finger protein XlCOF7.1-like [Eleutherodactylus coqui]|uniref:oocyte zinc finger protein XlCOF7.1-like n=1 Tax=Eleutherodactylus coqui TaxID=57060 RepID=UPI0034628735